QALEPRLLLSANPLDPAADRLGAALSGVSAEFISFRSSKKSGPFRASNKLLHIAGNRIAIEAAADDPAALKTALTALRFQRASIAGYMVSGWVPLGRLDDLANLPGLRFARPALFTTHAGSVTTQGDTALRADVARSTYGFTGAGVKVGVLSDSFDTGSGSYATDISTGDLPAGVQVIQDSPNGTDEGRAMAQIVHDVAPGASLAFATANGGESAFANNIRALANAGAKVIVDDVAYFAEPMFQDGVIAQAIDDVTAGGAVYFSAAGNEGHDAYTSTYTAATSYSKNAFGSNPGAPRFGGGTSHDFDPGPGVDDKQAFSLGSGQRMTLVFQWDQPFFSVSGGQGSRSDMDVFVLDADTNRIIAGGTDNNVGGDAVEVVQFINPFSGTHNFNLLIVRAAGTTPTQIKYVFFANANFSEFSQPQASSIYGHTNAAGADSVAATAFNQTPSFGIDPAFVESYSSAGGSPILFDGSGNSITPIIRQQPKFTAPDGGNTTFFGQDSGIDSDSFPNFFGTSAAAPHAAAVAALLLSAKPALTPAQVTAAMENTALDMDEPASGGFDTGLDLRTGYGLVQADAAIRSVLPAGSISGATFIDRDGDGVFDAGEDGLAGQTPFLDANNNGAVDLINTKHASTAGQSFGATGLISAPLKISGLSGVIDGVNLTLSVSHPDISQLHAILISPAGSRFAITLPPDGNLIDQPIGGVRGENPNGIWRLEIIDDVPGSGGSLSNWSLNLNTGDITATTDSSGQYSFPHLEKGAYSLRAALPPDFIRTAPLSDVHAVSLSAGASAVRDFGFFPTRFTGTSGDDQFTIALDPTHLRLQIGDYSIAKSLITSLAFDGIDGNDQLAVTLDATDSLFLVFDAGFDSLVINGGQIHLDTLAIPIDIATTNATLILFTNSSDRDSFLSQINQLLHSGRNGGLWNGSGIASSGAAADEQHVLGLAAVGSWQLDPSTSSGDVFVKLVRNGDSDIDGDVDADDYARLDAAWADPPAQSSYFTGDFNYNGRIDSDDFFSIDRAFSA
ncbi:MAG TPA: S8 family serine peptidase, partial [Tepidisphaeraceae bacterium]|nr:S8 family serine peptidase [Tepidisphaeraceae bacterium]